jgi:hypothetical protein
MLKDEMKAELETRKSAVEQYLEETQQRLTDEPARREAELQRVEAELQEQEARLSAEIQRAQDRIADYSKQIEDMKRHILQKEDMLKSQPQQRERALAKLEAEFKAEEGRLYMEIDRAKERVASYAGELSAL